MAERSELEAEAYNDFINKKNNTLGQIPGQFYPYRLEDLFATECENIARGLIYEKYNSDQAASILKGVYKGYRELKKDLN